MIGHGFTPWTSPFDLGLWEPRCRVMLARYPCPYGREEHDPDLPPEDLDAFGYRRRPLAPCKETT